jgi:pyrimidine deaminase RibD-like protein
VENVDERQLLGQATGELAGAVGRVVVDDEHTVAVAQHAAERLQHRLEVLALVVGREADDGSRHLRIFNA